jgi:hypothetical protein
LELSRFSDCYAKIKSSTISLEEIEATISILGEVQQWTKVVAQIETALENRTLDSVSDDLALAVNITETLERRTQNIAFLPKMKSQVDLLAMSARKAFESQWTQLISVEIKEDRSVLTVSEDRDGMYSISP